MYYCSRDCLEEDKKRGHRLECPYFIKQQTIIENKDFIGPFSSADLRVLLRYILKCRHHNGKALKMKFKLYDGRARRLKSLMDHADDLKTKQQVQNQFLTLAKFNKMGIELTYDELIKFYGQLAINSWIIDDEITGADLGLGLFVEVSIFNHSCQPNASHVFNSNHIQFRAIKPIDTDNEEILVNYTPILATKYKRQDYLARHYFFKCDCRRCLIPCDIGLNCLLETNLQALIEDGYNPFKHSKMNKIYKQIVTLLKTLVGEYHPTITKFYLEALKNLKYMDTNYRLRNEPRLIEKASMAALMTHGSDHPIFEFYGLNVNRFIRTNG